MARLVDIGRDDPESLVDVVGLVIHQESWVKLKKKLNQNIDEGKNNTDHSGKSYFGNWHGSKGHLGGRTQSGWGNGSGDKQGNQGSQD